MGAASFNLAAIRIRAKDGQKVPRNCEMHKPPVPSGDYYQFDDVSEQELAFWNTLTKDEHKKMEDEAYRRCFHEALHDFMKREAEKGEKMKQRENEALGGQSAPPKPPDNPPLTPPTGGPPIQLTF
jgi:hypothetical protein